MAKSLYICYFGVREPLVQTQVIPYLRELVKGGHEVSLLTFERTENVEKGKSEKEVKDSLRADQIEWYSLRYHKRFSVLATAWDVLQGTIFVRRFVATEQPDILHARVHVPMLMGAIARKLSRSKPKLLFDIRGFMPEEYVDAGIWPKDGLLYRGAKRIERWLTRNADGFVVLTEAARKILFAESKESGYDKFGRPVEVIPCCVDLSRSNGNYAESRTTMRQNLAIGDRKVLAYVGSFGGWYLSDEMMDLFSSAREKDSDVFVMILTQRDVEKVAQRLAERGFQDSDYFVASVDPRQVSSYLTAADIAVSLIKPCYSKLSSSPTKLAEYLVCGLPIISNRGVGDVDNLIEDHQVGVLLDGLSKSDYLKSLDQIEKFRPTKEHCVTVGQSEFDLGSVAGNRYRRLYERMTDRAGKDH